MKNKELYKLLKKNKSNTNSGFTLIELLIGLFMSIFVIGALGFGLMQVLQASQTEGSKTAARNETGRALDFISDEMRRAQAIEVDMSDTNIGAVASNYSKPTGGTVRLALQIPGVAQRVVYSVAPPESTSPWKGPLVIYRWGPELGANGAYTATSLANPTGWTNEALIDKVDNTNQTQACGGANTTYQGFFACVVDDDNDGVVETETTDTNTNGVIDNEDIDGKSITAKLYFTGETITVSGTSGYSADTQTVARARTAPGNTSEDFKSYTMSFRTLDPSFACKDGFKWKMRTDFGESLSNPGSITNWNHQENRQPQPIKISGDTLVISSIPRDPRDSSNTLATGCDNSRINNGREPDQIAPRDFSGNRSLGESENWAVTGKENVVAISHAINFKDPRTFNGDTKTCTSYPCPSSVGGKVYSQKTDAAAALDPSVAMLKYGSTVPSYGGYDVDGVRNYDADGVRILASGDQLSLGEFLFSKGLADKVGTGASATYTVNDKIKSDERIMGFEVGQTDTTKPGFDLQDNIFIVSSDAFKQKYDTYEESYTGYTPPTPPATLPSYTPLN